MSSSATSRRKILFKWKWSSLDIKIPFFTRCTAFGITDCETMEGSSRYYNYIVVGRSCDYKVTEQYFQNIN